MCAALAMVPQPITPTLIMGKLLSFVPRLAGRMDKMILAYPVDENKMRILDGKCKKEGAEAPSQIAVYGALPCGIFSPQART